MLECMTANEMMRQLENVSIVAFYYLGENVTDQSNDEKPLSCISPREQQDNYGENHQGEKLDPGI